MKFTEKHKNFISKTNILIFSLDMCIIVVLSIRYQRVFVDTKSLTELILLLVATIGPLLGLLTGKKHFSFKLNTEIFSKSIFTFFNVLAFLATIWYAIGVLNPPNQEITVKFKFQNEQEKSYFTPLKGRISLYVKTHNSGYSLIQDEPIMEDSAVCSFPKPDSTNEYQLILDQVYKLNRFHLGEKEKDTIQFSAKNNIHTQYVNIYLNNNICKVDLPDYITRIGFIDISRIGKYQPPDARTQESIPLINGEYIYTLYHDNDSVYGGFINIDNVKKIDTVIKFPLKSTDVVIMVPKGILKIKGDFLGTILARNGDKLRFLNDEIYNYTLTDPDYLTLTGTLQIRDRDQNTPIKITFPENYKKKESVVFNTRLFDGSIVTSKIFLNGQYLGESDSSFNIDYGTHHVAFEYVDTNPGNDNFFKYKNEPPHNSISVNASHKIFNFELRLQR